MADCLNSNGHLSIFHIPIAYLLKYEPYGMRYSGRISSLKAHLEIPAPTAAVGAKFNTTYPLVDQLEKHLRYTSVMVMVAIDNLYHTLHFSTPQFERLVPPVGYLPPGLA